MPVMKKVLFNARQAKKATSQEEDEKIGTVGDVDLTEEEKQQAAKDAYKEALKEVYKEKIEGDERKKIIPEEGKTQGILEQRKETVKKKELVKEKTNTLAMRQDAFLFEAKSCFPFDFFPDTLLIDATKLTIITKVFFATEQVKAVDGKMPFGRKS